MKFKTGVTFLLLLASVGFASDVSARLRVVIRPWWPRAIVVRPIIPHPVIVPRRLPPPKKVRAAKALLYLNIRPIDTRIFIDNIPRGRVLDLINVPGYIAIKPGSRTVTLRREGYQTEQFIVEAYPGQTTELDVTLGSVQASTKQKAPDPSTYKLELNQTGSVLFNITPRDASIYIDDEFYGVASQFIESSEAIVLQEGKHQVSIIRPGYIVYSTTTEVSGEKTKEIHVTLQPEKKVTK